MDLAAQVKHIQDEKNQAVVKLAQQSRKTDQIPDPSTEPWKSFHERLDKLLSYLETDAHISPELKQKARVDEILKLIYANPFFHFQEEQKRKAKELCDKFEADKWGAPPVQENERKTSEDDIEDDDTEEPAPKRPRTGDSSSRNNESVIKRPPVDHPIWGRQGIMHGLAIKKTADGRKSKVLNDEYHARDCKVFGHNGLTVGQWFPFRLSALFAGAHGASQAGIHGSSSDGAYSVVVGGLYEDLDTDHGDVLHYSGSGSDENTDPNHHAESTSGTKALHTSLRTGKPVRVLRTHAGQSKWAPTVGVRYDGLYEVVSMRYPKNARGGLYEQFRLERRDGQPSLDQCKRRPNGQDLRAFERIEFGYESRR